MTANKKKTAYILIITAYIAFGISFLFTKNTLNVLSNMQMLSYRFLVSVVFMCIMWITGIIKMKFTRLKIKVLLLMVLLQPILYFLFETIGIRNSSSSESGIMIALIPIMVTILAATMLKEKVGTIRWTAIGISVCGAIFLVLARGLDGSGSTWGVFALVIAVVCAGFYSIYIKKISSKTTPEEMTFAIMAAGAIFFNIVGIIGSAVSGNLSTFYQPLFTWPVAGNVLFLGLISSLVGFFSLNYAYSHLEASKIAIYGNITPTIALLAGVLIVGDTLNGMQIAGVVLIYTGIITASVMEMMIRRKSAVI